MSSRTRRKGFTFFSLGILQLQLGVVGDVVHERGCQGKGLGLDVDAGSLLMHASLLIQLSSFLRSTTSC